MSQAMGRQPAVDIDALQQEPADQNKMYMMVGIVAVVVIGGFVMMKSGGGGAGAIFPTIKKKADTTVIFKQPKEQKGTYTTRQYQTDACKTASCVNLKDMKCDDGTNCLMWGGDCYAGSVDVPQGAGGEYYNSWDCSPGDKPLGTFQAGADQSVWNLGDKSKRGCSFKVVSTECPESKTET